MRLCHGGAAFFDFLEDGTEREDAQIVFLLFCRTRNAEVQANMEGQSKVHIRELLLRVEVCAARNDPPAILVGVDVPHVMAGVQDGLRVDLLHEGHFEVGRLPFKVFPDFLDLLVAGFQHERLPR